VDISCVELYSDLTKLVKNNQKLHSASGQNMTVTGSIFTIHAFRRKIGKGFLQCFSLKTYRNLVSGIWTQTDILTDGTTDVVSTNKYT